MASPSTIDRLKSSRLVQALILYLGASWMVMEVAGMLQEALELPGWITPVAFVLLLVGLVVVLATAWVQSNPSVNASEAAGEVPETWEVGLTDLARSLRRGTMPHLTWGRAILGGIFAFWLLFGLAGLVVLVRDRGSDGVLTLDPGGPVPGLAIVPWSVSGVDPSIYREGMITLLGTTLDAAPGLRTVDSRTVLARWDELVGTDELPDLWEVLEVGRQAGARYVLVGSAVSAGPDVGLVGDLYDVGTTAKLGTARADGPPDSLMALVDRFAVETARVLLAEGIGGSEVQHLASLTTRSLDALLAYIEGERSFRRGDWNGAMEAYERAIRRDSAFALAHLRAAQALGWDEGMNSALSRLHLEAAERFRERLPPRESALLDALAANLTRDRDAIQAAARAARRYPDDPDLWFAVGDLHSHLGQLALRPVEEGIRALERAAELAPDFAPYLIHLTEHELVYGDSAAAAAMVRREMEAARDTTVSFIRGHRLAFAVTHGDSAARSEALSALEAGDDGLVQWSRSVLTQRPHSRASEAMSRSLWRGDPQNVLKRIEYATVLVSRGRVDRALEVLPASGAWGARLRTILHHYGLLPADSLRGMDWEGYHSFGTAYTALVLNDTATAASARAAFERELAEPDESWLLKFLDAFLILNTDGPAAAEAPLLETYDAAYPGRDLLVDAYLQWLIGDLYETLGEERRALDFFTAAARTQPLAALRAARLADRLGETDEARRLYREVLIAWERADPQFQPWVEEARSWAEPLPG